LRSSQKVIFKKQRRENFSLLITAKDTAISPLLNHFQIVGIKQEWIKSEQENPTQNLLNLSNKTLSVCQVKSSIFNVKILIKSNSS